MRREDWRFGPPIQQQIHNGWSRMNARFQELEILAAGVSKDWKTGSLRL
jgi:hypothetical protein